MRKITHSATETKEFAEKLAKKILEKGTQKKAAVLALSGELGSGKTTFAQGFFEGLGIKSRATSPTFIIFRRHRIPVRGVRFSKNYKLKTTNYSNVVHMDAYRIKKDAELGALGLKEIMDNPQNILLVEWAENIKKVIPRDAIKIKFSHAKKENERAMRTM